VLALAAIGLAVVSIRATELYAARYQSLPVMDWVESRPPLAESARVPAAADLVRGLSRVMPLLVIRDDARPRLPAISPPAYSQKTIGGVRDASRIWLGSPGQFRSDEVPVQARLDVIVFNRAQRAAAWSELMGREMDIRDPETAQPQARLSGPDEPDGVWVVGPRDGAGVSTVVGYRGVVGYVLQVTFWRQDTSEQAARIDLTARAETLARQAAADWSSWLTQQLAV
jgi:hypothetical protein